MSPRRAGGASPVFTQEGYERLAQRVFRLVTASQAELRLRHTRTTISEFVRGDAHMAIEYLHGGVELEVAVAGRRGQARTNQLDDAGLQRLVADAEAAAHAVRGPAAVWALAGPKPPPTSASVVFDSVRTLTGDARAALSQAALDATAAAGLIGAGEVGIQTTSSALINTTGLSVYRSSTYSEFSLTARTRDGTGSGWAWDGHEDWARVQPQAVIARAVDLAQRSAHPVAVEPGRYTVILEPAAVAELLGFNWDAERADTGGSVFSNDPVGTNKIGLRMLDERLGIISDPYDPLMPRAPMGADGTAIGKVVWFERGVLKNLAYTPDYARAKGRAPVPYPMGVRLTFDGPPQTLEEMIASTARGLWVNRLSGVQGMNALLTGTTRDGTFLIENGRITKPVKNLRFTESPVFALNKLAAAGEPVRAAYSVIAPRLKVRDFNFTSLTEAI